MYLLHTCIIKAGHVYFNSNRAHILCNMMLIPVMRNYFIHNCALFSLFHPDTMSLFTTTWFTKSQGRIHLLIVPQKNPDDRYFSNRHQDSPSLLFSAAVQSSLPASHPAINHIN